MLGLLKNSARLLPVPAKIVLHHVGAFAFSLLNKKQIGTPDGHIFDIPKGMSPFDCLSLARGLYEKDEIEMLRTHFMPETGTIIEIGGNIGVVAHNAIGEKLAPGGSYFCIEPNPKSLPALRANMQRTDNENPGRKIEIIQAAVGDPDNDTEEQDFHVRPHLGSGLAACIMPNAYEQTIKVAMTSLSQVVEQSPSPSISLICDAEGAEIQMLKDKSALAKIRQILIELHGPEITGSNMTVGMMKENLEQQGFICGGNLNNNFYFSRPS